MHLDEFQKLDLKPDQRISIRWVTYFEKVKKEKVIHIREIKETVLGPNMKDICVYGMDGGFFPVGTIEAIEVLPKIEQKSFKVHFNDESSSEVIKGGSFKQALKDYGIDRKDVTSWTKLSV